MTTVRDMLADLREDLRSHRTETREDFQRLHERVDSLREELETERLARHEADAGHAATKAWVKGAYAAVLAVAGTLGWLLKLLPLIVVVGLLSGCVGHGHWGVLRPVTVLIDGSMPEAYRVASYEAIEFWRRQGVDYLRAVQLDGGSPVFRGLSGLGQITVTVDRAPPPNRAGHCSCRRVEAQLVACAVLLADPEAARHEFGHALGLQHAALPGRVMSPGLDIDGDEVTDQERAWIR